MGNIMFHDEGIGTYLTKYLEANYEPHERLEIVDGGLLGFSLMTYYQEFDKIIVVGINSKEGEPGTIFRYSGEEMMAMGTTRQTANEVELTIMLEICSFHEEMGEVELVTMIPEDIVDVRNGLTDTIRQKMPELLNATLHALEEEGITLQKKERPYSFDEIIHQVSNPVTQRMA